MIALFTTTDTGGTNWIAEAFIASEFADRSYLDAEIDAGKARLRRILEEESITEDDLVEHRDATTSSPDEPEIYTVTEFFGLAQRAPYPPKLVAVSVSYR